MYRLSAKTKKVAIVERWPLVKFRRNISNTRDSDSSGYSNTEKTVENSRCLDSR